MSTKFPEVRLGRWMYDSINYISKTYEGIPEKYILKTPFNIISQKEGFVFAIDPQPESSFDGFGVWKEDGSKCYKQIYIVQEGYGRIGTNPMFIKKRDKQGKVTGFTGNFVQSGNIKETGGNPTLPICGIVNAYWRSDFKK